MAVHSHANIQIQCEKSSFQHDASFKTRATPSSRRGMLMHEVKSHPQFLAGSRQGEKCAPQFWDSAHYLTQHAVVHAGDEQHNPSENALRRKTPSGVLLSGYNPCLGSQLAPLHPNKRLFVPSSSVNNHRHVDACKEERLDVHERPVAPLWVDKVKHHAVNIMRNGIGDVSITSRKMDNNYSSPPLPSQEAFKSLINETSLRTYRGQGQTLEQRLLTTHPVRQLTSDNPTKQTGLSQLTNEVHLQVSTSYQSIPDTSQNIRTTAAQISPYLDSLSNSSCGMASRGTTINGQIPLSGCDHWLQPQSYGKYVKPNYSQHQPQPALSPVINELRELHQVSQPRTSSKSAQAGRLAPPDNVVKVVPEKPVISAEDASHPERVLAWAHKIYAALIKVTCKNQRQRQHNNSVCDRTDTKCNENYSIRRLHIRDQKHEYSRHPSANYDSLAYHSLLGLDRSQQFPHGAELYDKQTQTESFNKLHPNDSSRKIPNQLDVYHPYPDMQSNVSLNSNAKPSNRSNPSSDGDNSLECQSLQYRTMLLSHEADLATTARHAIHMLAIFCHSRNTPWMEGMMQAGCLAYAVGDYHESIHWFSKMLDIDHENVETMSKLAVALMAVDCRREAEHYWRLVLTLRPSFLEAAEHLVELLCSEQRRQDALQVVDHVRLHLRATPNLRNGPRTPPTYKDDSMDISPMSSISSRNSANNVVTEYDNDMRRNSCETKFRPRHSTRNLETQPDMDFGAVDGRVLALIHLKGNILYSLNDHLGAAQAFEEVVLMAVKVHKTLLGLIEYLLDTSSKSAQFDDYIQERQSNEPLLLAPKRALGTTKLCFPKGEHLMGIRTPNDWASRNAATSILSNSLLSLAKVFQDGLSSNANTTSASGTRYEVRHILALYYLSFSLKPSPSTANNIGILLACVQRSIITKHGNSEVGDFESSIPGVVPGSGTWLALKYYEYGLALDPKHAHLYTNLGSLLKDIGQLPLAIEMYHRAVTCDEKFDIALANLANAVKDQGKTKEAILYYKRAVEVNPNFSEAICGLANVLNSICDWTARGGMAIENGAYDRWHVDERGALVDSRTRGYGGFGWIRHVVQVVDSQLADSDAWGRGMFDRKSLAAFINQLLTHQLDLETRNKQARILREALGSWAGQIHEGSRIVRLVERAMRLICWRWYQDKHVNGREAAPAVYARPQLPASLPPLGAPKVLPFHTFTLPLTARQIRSISQRNGLRTTCTTLRAPWLPPTVYPPPPPPRPHLNIGYVSSDFNNHPLAHLMQSIFGLHNKNRVKAICYATTASDLSSHRQKIEKEAPMFHDASSWSTEQLVQQIVRDEVHILINLNGYTRGARNEVFAARPAPIQMSFMGYAGTLGAEWCDYILADDMAIPAQTLRPWRRNVDFEDLVQDENTGVNNDGWVYGENIIYTREAFFCCDHRQSASTEGEEKMTWEEEQRRRWKMRKELFPSLKDNAIIFGNFNQLYKIDPTVFRTWLRILSRVPDAILWLLRFPDLGESQLRQTANAWAGTSVASRIIFTDVAPKAVHIVRACVIDLFLDTPECNGHTTAADCLWSGTPLLTLPRYPWKMASRMAAGIVGGTLDRTTQEGRDAWRELVASSEDEYEDTAVRLARGLQYLDGGEGLAKGRLMDLRRLVWEGRWRRGGLFDTERWVREVEDAYEEAWRRWVKGEGGDIRLADL